MRSLNRGLRPVKWKASFHWCGNRVKEAGHRYLWKGSDVPEVTQRVDHTFPTLGIEVEQTNWPWEGRPREGMGSVRHSKVQKKRSLVLLHTRQTWPWSVLRAKGERQRALTALGSDGQDWGLGLSPRPRLALTWYFLPWAPEIFELEEQTDNDNCKLNNYLLCTRHCPKHSTFFFFFDHVAYGILVPRPGIRPRPLALEVWGLNHCTTWEVQHSIYNIIAYLNLTTLLSRYHYFHFRWGNGGTER